MSLAEPYPGLDEFLAAIGIAGQRLASIEASEGAAGNISIFIGWPIEVRRHLSTIEHLTLPIPLQPWLVKQSSLAAQAAYGIFIPTRPQTWEQ
jgi:hypothetical protein